MSYYRPGHDSPNAAGGAGRDRADSYRGLGRPRHGDGARDPRRSISGEHQGSASGSGGAWTNHSRWVPEQRGRSGEFPREWDRAYPGRERTPSRGSVREPSYDGSHYAGTRREGGPRHDGAPPFARRATEPGESLEEGEVEERRMPRPLPTRTFTSPGDVGLFRRRDSQSARYDRPPTPQQSASFVRAPERRPSPFRPDATVVRPSTPASPMRLGAAAIVRTPSPPLARRASAAERPSAVGVAVRARHTVSVAAEHAWSAGNRSGKARSESGRKTPSPKAGPADSERTPSPTMPQLQSRISDIDREIAECQVRLVQMSGTTVVAEADDAPAAATKRAAEDRAVPTSPPMKKVAATDSKALVRAQAEPTAVAALIVPQATAANDEVEQQCEADMSEAASDGEQGAAETSDAECRDGPKLRDGDLIKAIYRENQARAAAEHARRAAPFLECWPTFVPGRYAAPEDWSFWEENERIHERIKPHLAAMLGREKMQAHHHKQRLQREYSTLYTKWRRRVERLDRQRVQKQATGPAAAAATAAGPAGAGAFGTNYRRRTGPTSTVDEFGFSLGPLFSATPAADAAEDLYKSDAVHSEAELMAIIEKLQHSDARNPDLRSQRTAAVIPDMVVGPAQRALLRFDNRSHLIEDPLTFYHARMPAPGTAQHKRVAYANNGDADRYWTQEEASRFVAAYLTHPKQFGKIAAHIPQKTMSDCVLFYYRNKKPLRLKELEIKANRAARRSRQATGGRRRKERERRARRTQEERSRLAIEAAAECAPTDYSVGTRTSDDEAAAAAAAAAVVTAADVTGMLERRSRGSALLSSIISASRERKKEALLGLEDPVAGIEDLTPVPDTPYDEMSDEMSSTARPQQPAATAAALDPRKLPAPKAAAAEAVGPVAGEGAMAEAEDSDCADGDGGGDDDDDDDEADNDGNDDDEEEEEDEEEEGELVEDEQWEPRRAYTHARDSGRALSDSEEIVEACGVVVAEHRMPRIVSRRSQTRFGAMLTAVLDDAASPAPAQSTAAAGGGPLRESALDRFVAEHPAARRPLSSYEALRICPADGGDGGAADAALDAQVGPQDEVLVGAAAWQRDDRRRVLRALQRLGPDFAQVASLMPSKTTAQCRYFYYHYRTPAGALLSDVISGASPRKVPAAAQPDALVLPPAPAAASSSAAAPGPPLAGLEQPPAKRARTRSPAGSRSGSGSDDDGDDDDDDDDEMPLAAQLAEELAALQPREGASPMAVVAAGLVLPRPAQSSQLPAPPISATSNPSPHGASAKKSGYSSYWSVLERSAFLHHLARLGQNWLALAEAIGTKTGTQVRNYFRANQEKLGLDAVIVAYERNRAAGTLPPPEAFTPTSARDDAQARKEKRGRKRKGDAQPSPRPGSPDEGSAANSSVPSTAPASITSFPTIGVDGGRAVVLACPPPAPNRSLPTAEPPSLPRLHQWSRLPRDQAAQTTGHVPLHLVSEPTAGMGPRAGVVDRGDSSTPMSQPTPPPVEGLRLPSSSPAAAAVVGPRPMASRPRQMSALHISNLTTGSSTPQEEPRKVSVTKINALLNDDSPGPSHMSSDWFNDPPPADGAEPENADAEDDATGIAALALASMMGAAMQTHPPPPPPLPPPPAVAHQHLRPQPIHQPRPQIRTAAVSAFSPVVSMGTPVADRHLTRPSSTGPSAYAGPARQRKPSAPPLPTAGTPFGSRASFSGYHTLPPPGSMGAADPPLVRTPTLPQQGIGHQSYSPHMAGRALAPYPDPPQPPRYAEPMGRHQSPHPHYAPHTQYYYPAMSPGRQPPPLQPAGPPGGSQGFPALPPYHQHHPYPYPHHHHHHHHYQQPPPPPPPPM